jgi:hypothetical protein
VQVQAQELGHVSAAVAVVDGEQASIVVVSKAVDHHARVLHRRPVTRIHVFSKGNGVHGREFGPAGLQAGTTGMKTR